MIEEPAARVRVLALALCEALAEIGAARSVNELAEAWKEVARLRLELVRELRIQEKNGP